MALHGPLKAVTCGQCSCLTPTSFKASNHRSMKYFFLLQKGDLLKVTKQNENGIWEGELNGKSGEIPMSHVTLIDPNTLQPLSNGF